MRAYPSKECKWIISQLKKGVGTLDLTKVINMSSKGAAEGFGVGGWFTNKHKKHKKHNAKCSFMSVPKAKTNTSKADSIYNVPNAKPNDGEKQ